ncbi:hypothetical protein BJ742DRAFT_835698 [Cladochytrium replicatum]|nr:hypothetical protein BJ742DRAFT_835698 [Cladochytrium replicatum]
MATTAWRGSTSFLKLTVHTRTAATIPAGVAEIDVTISAEQGQPSLWILDAQDYSSWVAGQGDPKTYFYAAPPFTSLNTTLTFPQSHNCSVLIKCGRYATTIDGTATTVAENCSSVSFAVRWAVSPYTTSLITIPPTVSPSNSPDAGSTGLSVGAAAGIGVGAFAVAFAVAVAIFISFRRKKSKFSQQTTGFAPVPQAQPPQVMMFYPPQAIYLDPNLRPPFNQPEFTTQQVELLTPPSLVAGTNSNDNSLANSNQSDTAVLQPTEAGSSPSSEPVSVSERKGVVMLVQ